jgi:hypothetical protein
MSDKTVTQTTTTTTTTLKHFYLGTFEIRK